MTTPEADSIAELIDDCAQLPTTFRSPVPAAAAAVGASAWQVSEGNLDQVKGLDEYV